MANVRFRPEVFADVGVIRDRQQVRVWPYGTGPYMMGSFAGTHRQHYSPLDAQHVCNWLNERDAWAKAHVGDYTLDMIRKRFDR